MSAGTPQPLRPQHAEHLGRFRIPPEMIEVAGVRSVSDAEARETFAVHGHNGADLGGILFPCNHPLTGVRVGGRIRLDHLLSDGGKYISEPNCRHLFFAPVPKEWLADASIPVLMVESEKAALALLALANRARRKLIVIALGGCWGWRRLAGKRPLPNGGSEPETGPSPDFELVFWTGRTTILAFDSNASTNPKVRKARRALAYELADRGANVHIAGVPAIEGVNGPDDLIAVSGDEAMLSVLNTARLFAECALAEAEQALSEIQADKKSDPSPAIEAIAAIEDPSHRALLIGRFAALKVPGANMKFVEQQVGRRRAEAQVDRSRAVEAARQGRLFHMHLDPAALIADLERFFDERAHLPVGAAIILALWALFTYCVDAFNTAPYLCAESVLPDCGKTTVLDLLEAVCARPEPCSGLTRAVMVRTINQTHATMLVDQCEWLNDKRDESGIMGVMLAGYRRGKPYRCVEGESRQLASFDVFGPKAFCAIGGFRGALLSRCIVLHMERMPGGIELESAEPEDLEAIAIQLKERMEAFALKEAPALEAIKASRPKGGHWPQFANRERQLWTPLLTIARVCGCEVEQLALAAAEAMAKAKAVVQADDPRVAKTIALAELLGTWREKRFSPGDLVSALSETESWGESLAEKQRKDNTGKAAASLVGHFLRQFRLQSRDRERNGTTYETAEALAKARQHMPIAPQKSATSEASATQPMKMGSSGVADDLSQSTTGRSPSATGAARPIRAVADIATRSPTPETRMNRDSVADVADVADIPGTVEDL
jgi:hypothetical protein